MPAWGSRWRLAGLRDWPFSRRRFVLRLCGSTRVQFEPGLRRRHFNFWSHNGAKPGGEINLAVVLDVRTPYHINANTAKDPYIPVEVQPSARRTK
jgi:hypothetical protein